MTRLTNELRSRIAPAALALCSKLGGHGHRAWIVGGCLRDLLLGKAVADWDIATDARPEQVMRVFDHVVPTGIAHGTVTVLLDDEAGRHGFEVTTLRGETLYSDGRRPDAVYFVDDITADLARRDFTVNAIALDPLSGPVRGSGRSRGENLAGGR